MQDEKPEKHSSVKLPRGSCKFFTRRNAHLISGVFHSVLRKLINGGWAVSRLLGFNRFTVKKRKYIATNVRVMYVCAVIVE